jgi:hypothetical protein
MPARAQSTVQRVIMRPPPVRGINTVDPLALMQPTDAIEMDNLISSDSGLALRGGWYEYGVNVGGGATHAVRTIFSFDDATGSSLATPLSQSELFAATDNGIYLVEGGGNLNAVAAEIALSGAQYAGYFACTQYAAAGNNFLVIVSETDGAFLYDGVTWKKCTNTGAAGPGVITGTDPAFFAHVVSFKRRLGFVEKNSGKSWWLDPLVVGGVAKLFDFGPMLIHGGAVLAMINWTQDAGEGTDDYLVVLSTAGDVAIYKGSDPTSATDWQCAGTWYIGTPPVGRRCFTTSGGNIYIVTEFGIVPIAQVVQGGLDNVLTASTEQTKQLRKLQEQLNRDFRLTSTAVGWELLNIPNQALLHLARPAQSVTEHIQYVFHMHTLAWSRILDIPAETFYYRLGEVYGGTVDGRVLRLYDGVSDRMAIDGTGAQEVRARLTPAFDYFDNPPAVKRALMIRPNFQAAQNPAYAVKMNADLYINSNPSWPVSLTTGGSLWDASYWDVAVWGGGIGSWADWRSVRAMGRSLSPTLFIASQQAVILSSLSYMIQPGGPL